MEKRGDEEFARRAFDEWLVKKGFLDRDWSDGAEPPDFELVTGGIRYGVEVTQVQQNFRLGTGTLSEAGVTRGLVEVLRGLERLALERRVLRGMYMVHMEPIPDLRTELPQIEKALLAYLEATMDLPEAPESYLKHGPWGRQWTITKVAKEGAELCESIAYHGMALWAGEYMAILRGRIAEILPHKASKLEAVAGPKILLLIDRFHYADEREWKTLAGGLDKSGFHTVARLYHRGACQVLWSGQSTWM